METQPSLDYPDRNPPKSIALAEHPRRKQPKICEKRMSSWLWLDILLAALAFYYFSR